MTTLSKEVLDKYPTIKEWKDDVYTIENFITEQEDYKAYLRDEKIKQVLN